MDKLNIKIKFDPTRQTFPSRLRRRTDVKGSDGSPETGPTDTTGVRAPEAPTPEGRTRRTRSLIVLNFTKRKVVV